MRDEEEIARLMRQILEDSRYEPDDPAAVQINAPLALQQQAMESAYNTLAWVLGEASSPALGLEDLDEHPEP